MAVGGALKYYFGRIHNEIHKDTNFFADVKRNIA
jgi:hypothetical protein